MQQRIHWSLLALCVPLVMASKCVGRNVEIDEPDVVVQDVTQSLQVVSIDPAWARAGEPLDATVYGAGFVEGAQVRIGEDIEATRVTFAGDVRLGVTLPPLEAGRWDVWVLQPNGERSVLRDALQIQEAVVAEPMCASATLAFDFDSAGLTPGTKAELEELADCLSRNAGGVRLEGHCDERGTTEYNVALGQRRADAVEAQLLALGVSPQRMTTVSFGEERPANPGSGERAWAENRRVELRLDR